MSDWSETDSVETIILIRCAVFGILALGIVLLIYCCNRYRGRTTARGQVLSPPPAPAAPNPSTTSPTVYPTAGAPYPATGAPNSSAAAMHPTAGPPYPAAGAPYPTARALYPAVPLPATAPNVPDCNALTAMPPSYNEATIIQRGRLQ